MGTLTGLPPNTTTNTTNTTTAITTPQRLHHDSLPFMHHLRRKSGHGPANTSYTDVRKAVTVTDLASRHKSSRPAMTRRTTPQVSHKLGKNPREREREMEDEYWLSDERESFPQFWYVEIAACGSPLASDLVSQLTVLPV